MILFKPEHVEPILSGCKTQTRRLGKKRWKVGSVHQCRLNYRAEPFACVRVTAVRRERLDNITEEDARREGYPSVAG
ncbi:MAG TPA: ASCH domain-containing protein [Desulfotomaculum sp.]|nr:ASCH domain-containing protein [Desulfotomaculum sp.]